MWSLINVSSNLHTTDLTYGYLDLVLPLEFGVNHLQKNAVYQIE